MDMINRIVNLLNENNMTAKRLTELLEISPTAISEWKKRKTKPSVEQVRKIAEIFGVTTDYIINGTIHANEVDIDYCIDHTMLDVYNKLTTNHKNAVRDFFYLCLCECEKKAAMQKSAAAQEQQTQVTDSDSSKEAEVASNPFEEFSLNDFLEMPPTKSKD